ncbi:MAG: tRNA (adenosine(37)-N6)-threonylcarbamoyltransferase complex dimerization subunit type 1 TsaB [Planctomycetes bacterium]|nr:tRNA (adenosine(37)-N6)-threonylcarbamoyltransferase complex dimerization subunit type 1 TsaB [Planctomycetota bacterium]
MTEKSKKPIILALETSGRAGSVALGWGDGIISEKFFSAPMRHNSELFETIAGLLAKSDSNPSDIAEIYISIGPGSFTGIRIAVTMAKMMALAKKIRIVGVKTTDALAENAKTCINEQNLQINRIATIIDAKRNHFFTAVFEKNGDQWAKTTDDTLIKAAEFVERFAGGDQPLWLLGEGLLYYKDKFAADGIKVIDEQYWAARASGIYKQGRKQAKNGDFTPPKQLSPLYLRKTDAEENLEKRIAGK